MVDAGVRKMLGGCFDSWFLLLYGSCRADYGGCERLVLVWGVKGEGCTGYKEQ